VKLETVILSLVRTFIERQQVVFDVINTLRPDMFAIADKSVTDMQLIEIVQKYSHVSQSGVWHSDEGIWDYFFHGNGCRLTHQRTGEVIDWDAPNVQMFDPWKFLYWIKWAVATKPDHLSEAVDSLSSAAATHNEIKKIVNTALRTLTDKGIFEQASQGRLHFKSVI
jgi:hypothetical protein